MLPYRVRSAPSRYEVSSVTKGLVSNSTVTYLTRNDYPEGLLQISIRYPASLPMYSVNYSSLMSRYAYGSHAASCRPFGDSHICVRADLPAQDSFNIAQQPEVLAVLDRIASNLELAPSATIWMAGSTLGKPFLPEPFWGVRTQETGLASASEGDHSD